MFRFKKKKTSHYNLSCRTEGGTEVELCWVLTSALEGVGGQSQAPAALTLRTAVVNVWEGWVGKAGIVEEKLHSVYQDSNTVPSGL